ncbi:MAG TPA: bifunctional 4-hydroxy-2-oxoglutarate aldolase/2-dehydro-3-deoxy-phosphogluconate aldolase [Bryobacteraceae bacterium]|jgi:2-dehydro-3-deoxyphosphogluconate aldolase/(4S)-4-hydroxy-2-oxoglutarate aldolase|nr:bifunctional 4-hydroxy-2-oxoglutarate aldolase/2-dehydro-3-deoxy-phosphogluconate aldolase [Bryobacteraceae bacterium]
MDKQEILSRVHQVGIIPAIRVATAEDALFASRAVFAGGIPIAEITMTIPGALDVLSTLRREIPEMILGAGTIWRPDIARLALEAGARFLTTTGLVPAIVEYAVHEKIPVLPGALTPTEVAAAWMSGADMVKIFPCSQVGGAPYIRMLKAPFPSVRFIASGGVTQQTAGDFILAGASGLGIGSDLIPQEAIRARRPEWIQELARRFLLMVREARQKLSPNHLP